MVDHGVRIAYYGSLDSYRLEIQNLMVFLGDRSREESLSL